MVSLATLRTDSYNVMYGLLQTGTYKISTDNIHPRYNDAQLKQEDLPQVIIGKVRVSKIIKTLGIGIREAIITFEIEVRHNSAANLRALIDEIDNKIDTGISVFTAAGLHPIEQPQDAGRDENYYAPRKTMHIDTLFYEFRFMG